MILRILFCILFTLIPSLRAKEVLVVAGLGGSEEYREIFQENIQLWSLACGKAGVPCEVLGNDESETGLKEKLQKRLAENGDKELWLILIGHGTFDERTAKFNIAGEDFTAKELAEWCKPVTGELVVVNTASASSPYLTELAGENRTIITATKSPNEIFYARFGEYFSKAIAGHEEADLDNDDQVSLLEAFLYSSNKVTEFYSIAGRLATEHALIDDNGDGLGTRAEWFEGVSATKTARDGAEPDGLRAMQQVLVLNNLEKNFPPELRKDRDTLERKVRLLRRDKPNMPEDNYYKQLEDLLQKLGRIYQQAEKASAEP
ncbi:MAG: hypothetical protein P1V20_28885 [Verrucomicrobiales bacterium]|nr:hypothetical protein [Verrucomicrobiales bacterium]